MTTFIGIYGASGFGREVLPVVKRQLKNEEKYQLVFIDDATNTQKDINGAPSYSYTDFLKLDGEKLVTLAIANSKIRKELAKKIALDGIKFFNTIDPTVLIFDEVNLGEGAILCPHVQLTSNITIGKHFHANIYSYVAHDCIIGDYVTFAPKVSCNGNIIIEDYAYIGTGAILRQGTPDKPLRIGKGAVIGMGAVVLQDVPAGVTVVGNPAKPLIKK